MNKGFRGMKNAPWNIDRSSNGGCQCTCPMSDYSSRFPNWDEFSQNLQEILQLMQIVGGQGGGWVCRQTKGLIIGHWALLS